MRYTYAKIPVPLHPRSSHVGLGFPWSLGHMRSSLPLYAIKIPQLSVCAVTPGSVRSAVQRVRCASALFCLYPLSQRPARLLSSAKMSRRSHRHVTPGYRDGRLGGQASSREALRRCCGENLLDREPESRVLSRPVPSRATPGSHLTLWASVLTSVRYQKLL